MFLSSIFLSASFPTSIFLSEESTQKFTLITASIVDNAGS
jgi:hypothetical protein